MPDQSPIEALIERAGRFTGDELTALAAAWHASDAILDAWAAAWAITWSAALALSTRDQLDQASYGVLTGLTIRARVIGRVHPDDARGDPDA
jgi:hypothetical protein